MRMSKEMRIRIRINIYDTLSHSLNIFHIVFVIWCAKSYFKMDKRKTNRQWQKDEVKKLIEELEARPDLWDPSRPNYQNR